LLLCGPGSSLLLRCPLLCCSCGGLLLLLCGSGRCGLLLRRSCGCLLLLLGRPGSSLLLCCPLLCSPSGGLLLLLRGSGRCGLLLRRSRGCLLLLLRGLLSGSSLGLLLFTGLCVRERSKLLPKREK
jgi:hypothetical protein